MYYLEDSPQFINIFLLMKGSQSSLELGGAYFSGKEHPTIAWQIIKLSK